MIQDMIKYVIMFFSALFYFENNLTFADSNIKTFLGQATSEELLSSQANGTLIVDIRRQDEWIDTGIIKGAETITAFKKNGQIHPEFQKNLFALIPSKSTPILLYCRTGNRTNSIGNALIKQLGLSDVSHLSSGISGWIKEGRTTIKLDD